MCFGQKWLWRVSSSWQTSCTGWHDDLYWLYTLWKWLHFHYTNSIFTAFWSHEWSVFMWGCVMDKRNQQKIIKQKALKKMHTVPFVLFSVAIFRFSTRSLYIYLSVIDDPPSCVFLENYSSGSFSRWHNVSSQPLNAFHLDRFHCWLSAYLDREFRSSADAQYLSHVEQALHCTELLHTTSPY